MRTRWLWFAWMVGCGGGSGPAQDAIPPDTLTDAIAHTVPPHQLAEPQTFLRVELSRSAAGEVAIASLVRVELAEVPLPASYGDHVLEARSGSSVQSARLVSFDAELRTSEVAEDGMRSHTRRTLDTAHSTLFIEADTDVDTLRLLGPDGAVLAEADARGALPAQRSTPARLRNPRAATREELALRFPAIRFLGADDEAALDPELLEGAALVEPSSASGDAIASALDAMAPGLRGAVTTIGVVDWPTGGGGPTRFGASRGSQFLLNGNLRNASDRRNTVVHEVAHNFVNLTRAQSGASSAYAAWPDATRSAVTAALQRYGIAQDIVSVWGALQSSGRAGDYTYPYAGEEYGRLTPSQATRGGFATPYGASTPDEDIAEYAMVLTNHDPTDICDRFSGAARLDARIAIPYAKMLLLRGVGAVDTGAFDACVHSVSIEGPPGIHFADSISFTSDVRAGFAASGPRAFRVLGKGPNTYEFLIEVMLRGDDAPALGLHRLDDIWFLNVAASDLSGAYLANDDPYLARAGEQGLVLIAEASAERVRGAVFGLELQNAVGYNTDSFPYGTFLVEP